MKIPDSLKRYGLAKVYDYLDKDPMNNMGKVMDLVNKFAGDTLSLQREAFDKVINDKDSCWHQLIEKVWTQTDPSVLKTIFNNFFVNANLVGWPKQRNCARSTAATFPGPSCWTPPPPVICMHRLLGGGVRQQAQPDL